MLTTFKKGDRVRSTVDTQGLVKGGLYDVARVEVVSHFLGVVTYVLVRVGDSTEVRVTNGHMLLEIEPSSSACARESWCVRQAGHAGICAPTFVHRAIFPNPNCTCGEPLDGGRCPKEG